MYVFLERNEGKEKEGEKHRCEREISIGFLPYVPDRGPNTNSSTCWNETGGLSLTQAVLTN